MKTAAVVMVLIILFTFNFAEFQNEKLTILIELPDGRIYWGNFEGDLINATSSMCKAHNLDYKIKDGTLYVDYLPLSLYHWNNGWIPGPGGTILAWSQSIPHATPHNRYPRFSAYPEITHYAPGNWEVWNISIGSDIFGSIDSTVVGYKDRIYINTWSGLFAISTDGNVLWKNGNVKGIGTPYIYNNTIYVGSSDGYLYALDLSGNIIFKKKISISPGYVGVTSSPTVVNGTLYIGGFESDNRSARLYALSPEGKELWNISLNSTVYYGSIYQYRGTIYVPLAGKYNASEGRWYGEYGIIAIRNREIIWRFSTKAPVKSTPTVANESLIFSSTDGYLYRISLNGTLMWKTKIGYSTSSPTVYNNTIYVGSGSFSDNGTVYAVDMNGNILWNRTFSGGIQSGITIAPPFLYFSVNSDRGGVICLKLNGSFMWRFPASYVLSTPTIINSTLYFGDDDGYIHALEDIKPPKIIFKGNQFYKYGEEINLEISAKDDMGIREMIVKCRNSTYYGKNNIKIKLRANFTGLLEVKAQATDYSGNIKITSYRVYVYNRTLKILMPMGDTFLENESVKGLIYIYDEKGDFVDDALVTIYLDNKTLVSGHADKGVFSFTFQVPRGRHLIRVFVIARGYEAGQFEKEIYGEKRIEEENTNWSSEWIIALVIAITIMGILFAILLKDKERKYGEIIRERFRERK